MKNFTTSRNPITKKRHPSPALYRWGAALLWLLVWQMGAVALGQPLLLPTPLAVALRLCQLGGTVAFWQVTLGSVGRILAGLLLGVASGCLLAVLTSCSALLRALAALPMGIIKATPVASFVILALLFLRGSVFSVLAAFIIVLPVVWSTLDTAITQVDVQLLEMARAYRFGRWRTLRYVYLPAVLPQLMAALRTGVGFAWKSGVAAEVIATPKGAIGTQLYNAKVYLETTDLFAWTVTIILLSLLLELAVVLLGSRVKGGKTA